MESVRAPFVPLFSLPPSILLSLATLSTLSLNRRHSLQNESASPVTLYLANYFTTSDTPIVLCAIFAQV